MFDLSNVDVSKLSGWSAFVMLALLITISMIRGWLVARSSVKDIRAGYESQLERSDKSHKQEAERIADDANDWRDSSLSKDTVIFELTKQNGELLEGTRTAQAVLRALPSGGERRGRSNREAGESQR